MDPTTLLAVCWLLQALVELKSPQAIRGIAKWAKKVFGYELAWSQAAENMAIGRFEFALKGFEEVLSRNGLEETVVSTINDMVWHYFYE